MRTTTQRTSTSLAARGSLLLAGACLQWTALTAEAAGGIWRCGKNSYSDRPCHDSQPLEIDDSRTPEQKRAADQHTREARDAADRMERERLRLEAAAARQGMVLIDDERASKPPAARAGEAKDRKERKKPEELRLKPRKDPVYRSSQDPSAAPAKKQRKTKTASPP